MNGLNRIDVDNGNDQHYKPNCTNCTPFPLVNERFLNELVIWKRTTSS